MLLKLWALVNLTKLVGHVSHHATSGLMSFNCLINHDVRFGAKPLETI